MTDEDTDILIVGGGVAGLALAGFLERDGYRPTVVERSGEGDGSGWAIGLRPNGVSVLDKLGVLDEALARGSMSEEVGIRTSDGASTTVPTREGMLALHRSDLIEVLRGALSRSEVRRETSPQNFETDRGSVEVGFGQGTEPYDIVVGADGIGSWVGSEMLDTEVVRRSTVTWSFRVPSSAEPVLPPNLVSLFAPGTGAIADEVNGRALVNISTKLPPAETPQPPALDLLRDVADDIGWRIPDYVGTLDDTSEVYFRRDYEVTAPSWHSQNAVLVGDAAHAVHPIVAAGATLALEDGYVLADELVSESDPSYAFASFEKRRRARVKTVRKAAHVAERVAFSESSLLTVPRNTLARILPVPGFGVALRGISLAKPSLDEV